MLLRREAALDAAPDDVWRVIGDPESLPRWWPGVTRVEEATPEAWTTVLSSPRGKTVRADYTRIEAVEGERVAWRQELEESPFERILASAVTSIALSEAGSGATRVEIALEQRPRGWARFAPLQFRAAGRRQVQGALDGLKALFGEPGRS
jgi:uncharacterized protein YndB with AHSA1/START domain